MTWEFVTIYVTTVALILGWKWATTWGGVQIARLAPEQVAHHMRGGQ